MKLRNAETLLSTTPPWLFSVTCTPSEITDLGWALQQQEFADSVVRRIRGAKMKTVASLFDEIASALQFPYYFGENWDALDECLNDLEWLPGRSYLLLVPDAIRVLSEEAEEQFTTFVSLLTRTGEEWAKRCIEGKPWDRPPTPFHVVMQCFEGEEAELANRIVAAGGEILPLTVIR
jgi:RNAse (barnase) inhibitor barstar